MATLRRLVPALVLLACLAAANQALPRWYAEQFKPPAETRTRVDLLLDFLGELRTFMARVIYMKADVYHHILESQGVQWTQEKDILPIYRMSALLDPHLVDAYDTAGYDLVMNFHRPDEGLAFLDEGIRANPQAGHLYLTRAFLLFQLKRYDEVIPSAGQALRLATEYFDQLNAVRLLGHASRELGNRDGEVHALRIVLTMRPDDQAAAARLKELGLEPRGFTEDELRALQHQGSAPAEPAAPPAP